MKIGIIGAGAVGSAAAYACVLTRAAHDIVLIDHDPARAHAEAQDVLHATPFAGGARVRAGSYDDLGGVTAVVIAAGVAQRPGESRLELLGRNEAVFKAIIEPALAAAPDALLIVATNPVDIMTEVATRLSGLPPSRVIGTGTILDTARFRALLARHLQVSPESVHAYVLGEHGDSEVLCWSVATIGTIPIEVYAKAVDRPLGEEARAAIDHAVRHAAQKIITGKGYTNYGIGGGVSRLVRAIDDDEHLLMSVSMLTERVEGRGPLALSLPRVVGRAGIVETVLPDLAPHEHAELGHSADVLLRAAGR
ncbi:MAG: L-lactate dehydrogenase [Pseudomonadota bacterium]